MAQGKWDPVRELTLLRDHIRDLFEQGFAESSGEDAAYSSAWSPAADVYTDGDQVILRIELPGVERQDLAIEFHQGKLLLTGERRAVSSGTIQRMERNFGRFRREFQLPGPVDADGIQAQLDNGVLTVFIPVEEGARDKKVNIPVQPA